MDRVDELAQQLDQLEVELARIRRELQPMWGSRPVAWAPPPTSATARAAWAPPSPPSPLTPTRRPPAEPLGIDAERILKWSGVGLVVLAIGFAVSTAISRGWIGRELQLAAALGASAALVYVGVHLRSKQPAWMHALCTGGVTGAAITVASPLLRDITDESMSIAATVSVVVLSLLLAAWLRSERVLGAATVAGTIGWWASAGGDPAEHATAIWLAALLVVVVGVSTANRWCAARVVAWGAGAVAFVVAAVTASGSLDRSLLALAGGAFVVGWAWLAGNGEGNGEGNADWRQLELMLATLVAPWSLLMTGVLFELDGDTQIGWTALAVAAVFACAIGLGWRHTSSEHLVVMIIGTSVVVTIGLGVLLDADVAVLAVALQGAGLTLLAGRVQGGGALRVNGWVLLASSALALATQVTAAWERDVSIADDAVHAIVIALVAGVAWKTKDRQLRMLGGAASLALTLVWLGSVLVHLPQGQALVSVSWAVVGTLLLVAGAARKLAVVAQAGLIVFGLTAAKLLSVDLRAVDTLWRAGLFMIVGVVFLRLGFLLPRLTSRESGSEVGRERQPPATVGEPPAAA